jgi:hypothetical protein
MPKTFTKSVPPDPSPDGNPGVGNGKSRPTGQKGGDALILALAAGLSVPQAAKRAGLGVNTAYVRVRDPAVRRAVAKARDDLLSQAVGRLADAAVEAVDVLRAALRSKSEGMRARAALGILGHMIRGMEAHELARRLTDLEEGRP